MERKGLMIVLDGFGKMEKSEFNAVTNANTPYIDELTKKWPNATIATSGLAVGLPDGQMGNSEVGHTNIGAGRVVYQDYTKISKAITDNELKDNKVITKLYNDVSSNNSTLHLIGLFSDGGVHSDIEHLKALVKLAKDFKINSLQVHALLDGRDTPPQSAPTYFKDFSTFLKDFPDSYKIGSVSGRFYAMDRDKRYERVKQAFDNMVGKNDVHYKTWEKAIEERYKNGENDEFIKPFTLDGFKKIQDNDGIFFFNFRADRAREISHVFLDDNFDGFDRGEKINLIGFVSMTEYEKNLDTQIAFPKETLSDTMGEIISRNSYSQLRIAETEKYAHVTFFFNGGVETLFEKEDRILVPSPRDVETYDEKPQMSIYEVTEKLIEAIKSDKYKLIVLNYANGDMVGHTGMYEAAIEAVQHIDKCLSKLIPAAIEHNYVSIITADHGNSEQMWDYEKDVPHTQHTTGPVPIWIINAKEVKGIKKGGALKDLSPTMLDLLNIEKPKAMTGESLAIK